MHRSFNLLGGRCPLAVPHMFASLIHFPAELLVINIQPVDIGAPPGGRFYVMHSILELLVGRTEQAGHFGVLVDTVATFGDTGDRQAEHLLDLLIDILL